MGSRLRNLGTILIGAIFAFAGCAPQPKPDPAAERELDQMIKRAANVETSSDPGKVLYVLKCDPAIVEVRDVGIINVQLGRFTCQLHGRDGSFLRVRIAAQSAEKGSIEQDHFDQTPAFLDEKLINEALQTKLYPAVLECANEEQRREIPGGATQFARKWAKDGHAHFEGFQGIDVKLTDEQAQALRKAIHEE